MKTKAKIHLRKYFTAWQKQTKQQKQEKLQNQDREKQNGKALKSQTATKIDQKHINMLLNIQKEQQKHDTTHLPTHGQLELSRDTESWDKQNALQETQDTENRIR